MSGPYSIMIERFSLHDNDSGRTLHYERDEDLHMHTKAARRGGDVAAVLLVELGIDGSECHQARLDFGTRCPDDDAFAYRVLGDEVRVLTDAIETLTALRDVLSAGA
jgi:hypothetical protein